MYQLQKNIQWFSFATVAQTRGSVTTVTGQTWMFVGGGGTFLCELGTFVVGGQGVSVAAVPDGAVLQGEGQRLGLTVWTWGREGATGNSVGVQTHILLRDKKRAVSDSTLQQHNIHSTQSIYKSVDSRRPPELRNTRQHENSDSFYLSFSFTSTVHLHILRDLSFKVLSLL